MWIYELPHYIAIIYKSTKSPAEKNFLPGFIVFTIDYYFTVNLTVLPLIFAM